MNLSLSLSLSHTHTHKKKTNPFVNFFSIPYLTQVVADYPKNKNNRYQHFNGYAREVSNNFLPKQWAFHFGK
jgi:hypothetical protein